MHASAPGRSPVPPMTSRQRLLTAARCAPCDHVPVAPFGLGALPPEGEAARRLVQCCDPFLEAGLGVSIFGGRNYVEKKRVVKTTQATRYTVHFPCRGPADLDRLLSIPWECPEPDVTGYRNLCERYGEDALVLVGCPDAICLPAEWMSPQDFCLLRADEPDLLAAVVREAARRVEQVVEAACRAGVRAFRIIGAEYASTQLGPAAFDELVLPHDQRLVQLIHAHGGVAYYHMHGPIMDYLDRVAQIGVDFLDPVEMPPYGDADLQRAREIIEGRFCIVGTFDDMEVLGKWPLEKIEQAALERLEQFGTLGICLGGSASGTYTEQAARAFCAMAELVRKQLEDPTAE